MGKFETAVWDFIDQMGYLENPHVLGIVVYGSYVTGYSHNKSDVDLHIVMDDSSRIYRGVMMVDGFKIEYFEKPISDLYASADNDFLTQTNALLPIIGNGKVLYEKVKNGHSLSFRNLRKYIQKKYSQPLPPLEGDNAREMAVIIDNRMIKLKSMLENGKPEFLFNYYLVVEKIRKFYSRRCGCADIPVDKIFRIYTDKAYRDSFCKSTIPDEDFIQKLFNAILNQGSNFEKMALVEDLFEYAIRGLDINPSAYRIEISSRNNPLNRNHE